MNMASNAYAFASRPMESSADLSSALGESVMQVGKTSLVSRPGSFNESNGKITNPFESFTDLPLALQPASEEQLQAAQRKSTGLRRGKWTPEEEAYANRVIQEFKAGLLPLTEGTTLRTFLSKLLNCDPMRISKKYVGPQCIGKQVFRRRPVDPNSRELHEELDRTRRELANLEQSYLDRLTQTTKKKKKRKRESGLLEHDAARENLTISTSLAKAIAATSTPLVNSDLERIGLHHGAEPASMSFKSRSQIPGPSNSKQEMSTLVGDNFSGTTTSGRYADYEHAHFSSSITPESQSVSLSQTPVLSTQTGALAFSRVESLMNFPKIMSMSDLSSFEPGGGLNSDRFPRTSTLEHLSNLLQEVNDRSLKSETGDLKAPHVSALSSETQASRAADDRHQNSAQGGYNKPIPRISSLDSLSTKPTETNVPRIPSLSELTKSNSFTDLAGLNRISSLGEIHRVPSLSELPQLENFGLHKVPSLSDLMKSQSHAAGSSDTSKPIQRVPSLSDIMSSINQSSSIAESSASGPRGGIAMNSHLSTKRTTPGALSVRIREPPAGPSYLPQGALKVPGVPYVSAMHRVSSIEDIMSLVANGDMAAVNSDALRQTLESQLRRSDISARKFIMGTDSDSRSLAGKVESGRKM